MWVEERRKRKINCTLAAEKLKGTIYVRSIWKSLAGVNVEILNTIVVCSHWELINHLHKLMFNVYQTQGIPRAQYM